MGLRPTPIAAEAGARVVGLMLPHQRGTDRQKLREEAYVDSSKLADRGQIYRFQHPRHDIWSITFGLVDWPAGARLLDVGCGPGSYMRRAAELHDLRMVGADLSVGMAREARAHAPTVNADVAQLPFATGSFDRVLAPHMLYHVPDIDAGVAELRRVLRPDGVALVTTNSVRHHRGLLELLDAVGTPWQTFVERFSLENGAEFLGRHFDDVRVERLQGDLVVTEADPVVRFVASMDTFTPNIDLDVVRQRVQADIDRDGAFRSPTDSGIFVCR